MSASLSPSKGCCIVLGAGVGVRGSLIPVFYLPLKQQQQQQNRATRLTIGREIKRLWLPRWR